MDEKLLLSLGLSQNQARAYRALVLKKSLRPSQLVKFIGESRTNCYSLLDKLVTLGLATKQDVNKKFTYFPTSPLSLKIMLEKKQLETEHQLQQLEYKLPQMLTAFHEGGQQPRVQHYKGKSELEQMYIEQMEATGRDLHFIRSKSDIPYFGLKKMLDIRYLAPKYKKRRYGITPIVAYAQSNRQEDAKAGGLKRTWVRGHEYTADVEWAVSGDTVQAILFKGEGYGVSITSPEIAESFRQIMSLLSRNIKSNPDYDKLPKPRTSQS